MAPETQVIYPQPTELLPPVAEAEAHPEIYSQEPTRRERIVENMQGMLDTVIGSRQRAAVLLSAVALAGVASETVKPADAGTNPIPPPTKKFDVSTRGGIDRLIKIEERIMKTCPVRLEVNMSSGRRHDQESKVHLSAKNINNGHRKKFSWRHPKSLALCAIEAERTNYYYFPKPTKKGKNSGYYIDPVAATIKDNSKVPITTFTAFFRKK